MCKGEMVREINRGNDWIKKAKRGGKKNKRQRT